MKDAAPPSAVEAGFSAAAVASPSLERRPDIAAYLRERVEPQLAWHEATAARSKRRHFGLATVQLGATAAIPVVNTMAELFATTIVTSLLAGGAAVAAGLSALSRHQETWLRSRRTVASLEEALARYRHGVAPFATEEADFALVRTVEEILRGESESWQSEMAKKPTGAGPKAKTEGQ